MIQYIERLESV